MKGLVAMIHAGQDTGAKSSKKKAPPVSGAFWLDGLVYFVLGIVSGGRVVLPVALGKSFAT